MTECFYSVSRYYIILIIFAFRILALDFYLHS